MVHKTKPPTLQEMLRGAIQESSIKRHSNKRYHTEQKILHQIQQDVQRTQIRNELIDPKHGNVSIPVQADIRDLKKEKAMLDGISKIISQELVNITNHASNQHAIKDKDATTTRIDIPDHLLQRLIDPEVLKHNSSTRKELIDEIFEVPDIVRYLQSTGDFVTRRTARDNADSQKDFLRKVHNFALQMGL